MKVNSHTGTKIGLKDKGVDIHSDMTDVVKDSHEYLVMGSYSMNMTSTGFYKFQFFSELCKKAKSVDCIAVIPHIFHSYYKPTVNDQNKLQKLINKNIGVIINNSNHSKFLFSENDLYLGSANLTPDGFKDNVESVCLFRDISKVKNLELDLIDFSTREFDRYISGHAISINDEEFEKENNRILASFEELKDLAIKLNPNIGKVVKTVSYYDKTNSIVNEAINQYFCLLSLKDFSDVSNRIFKLMKDYNKLIEYGNYLIDLYLKEGIEGNHQDFDVSMSEVKINKYNKLHSVYMDTLSKLIFFIEGIPKNIKVKRIEDDFTIKNYELVKKLKAKLEVKKQQNLDDNNNQF